MCALALGLGSKFHAPWIDTKAQPGDGGTRPVHGQLQCGRVVWRHRYRFLQVFSSDGNLADALRGRGYDCEKQNSYIKTKYAFWALPRRRSFLRSLETYELGIVFWALPDPQQHPDLDMEPLWDTIALGINMLRMMHTPFWVYGRPGSRGWEFPALVKALQGCDARRITINLSNYSDIASGCRCISYFRSKLGQAHCSGCKRRTAPRAPRLHDVESVGDAIDVDPPRRAGGLPPDLCAVLASSVPKGRGRGRGLATDSEWDSRRVYEGLEAEHPRAIFAGLDGIQ